MELHPQDPVPESTAPGAATSYYHSTSPVPVPGATVLTPGQLGFGLGLGLGHSPAVAATAAAAAAAGAAATSAATHHHPVTSGAGTTGAQHLPTFDPPPLVHTSPLLVQNPADLMEGGAVATATTTKPDLKRSRAGVELNLGEYMTLQRQRYSDGAAAPTDLEARIRAQADVVARDLSSLQGEIAALAKAAERHRWRRWLIGGIIGTFIPAVRAIFRRPRDEADKTSNDTEYAFYRSKTLIGRILDSVHGIGGLASMTFFVFAVMYVFQNEVSMRVAKTVGKRLKRIEKKVEAKQDISESDLKLLNGWRWRVLTWA